MSDLDREKAREVLNDYEIEHARFGHTRAVNRMLDALAGCLTDDPPSIDRDALTIILNLLVASGSVYPENVQAAVDAILALLRPDPRIAKLEALTSTGWEYMLQAQAILRGEA